MDGSLRHELLLEGAERVAGRESLDGADMAALECCSGQQAGIGWRTIDEDRTGPAFTLAAAFFRALEGVAEDAGRTIRIEFQNENLVIRENGEARVTVPDLISLITTDSG